MHPDSAALVGLLPHRPPFRFIDAVLDLAPGKEITGSYTVTGDETFLAGHFPGNAIFPGVLQIEALAQAGAIVLLCLDQYAGKLPLFGGIERARFRRVVRPGDVVTLHMAIEKLSARGGWAAGRAHVGGETCCEARLLFAIG
jgi:3-hydroxyacyl-[acyl-carrier-protein] dehydratase